MHIDLPPQTVFEAYVVYNQKHCQVGLEADWLCSTQFGQRDDGRDDTVTVLIPLDSTLYCTLPCLIEEEEDFNHRMYFTLQL